MAREFTRYQLRKQAETLGVSLSYELINDYIALGLLPDPDVTPWTEETVVPRLLRVHELGKTLRSRPRRVVLLYLERFPVSPEKLRVAMVDALPSIERPARTMARIQSAVRWFGEHFSSGRAFRGGQELPAGWKPPRPSEWAEVLQTTDRDFFEHRVGIQQYLMSLLAELGKNTPHNLGDVPPDHRLVLLLIRDLAGWRDVRTRAHENSETNG